MFLKSAVTFLLTLGFLCGCGGRKAEVKELKIQLEKDREFLSSLRENNKSTLDRCLVEESSDECDKRIVESRETRVKVQRLLIEDIAESERKIAELQQELANENGNVVDK